jgi:hypothetical protein
VRHPTPNLSGASIYPHLLPPTFTESNSEKERSMFLPFPSSYNRCHKYPKQISKNRMHRFSETEGGGWIKGAAMWSKEWEEISHLSLSSEPSCSCFFSLLLFYSCSGAAAGVC